MDLTLSKSNFLLKNIPSQPLKLLISRPLNILGLSLCHGVIFYMSFNTNIEKYLQNATLKGLHIQNYAASKNWNMQFTVPLNILTNNCVLVKLQYVI